MTPETKNWVVTRIEYFLERIKSKTPSDIIGIEAELYALKHAVDRGFELAQEDCKKEFGASPAYEIEGKP